MKEAQDTWLTVISVHKDDLAGLLSTLGSLAEQDLTGVQHMVVDGSNNPQDVMRVVEASAQTRSEVYFQPPAGVYSAMNFGLAMASGKYLMFLNAGDRLSTSDVISAIRATLEEFQPCWIFGDAQLVSDDGVQHRVKEWSYDRQREERFRNGRFPQQPAMVVLSRVLSEIGGFDSDIHIAADYKAMIRLSRRCDPVRLNMTITHFQLGGVSTVNWKQSLWEAYRVRCSEYELTFTQAILEFLRSIPHFARATAYRCMAKVSIG
jgi:glycosyltransferase involved in cell wall biosynthesis